jgi:hypothetical protein
VSDSLCSIELPVAVGRCPGLPAQSSGPKGEFYEIERVRESAHGQIMRYNLSQVGAHNKQARTQTYKPAHHTHILAPFATDIIMYLANVDIARRTGSWYTHAH